MKNSSLFSFFFSLLFIVMSSCSKKEAEAVIPDDEVPQEPKFVLDEIPGNPINVVKFTSGTALVLEKNELTDKSSVRSIFYLEGKKVSETLITEKAFFDIMQMEVDTDAKYVFWRSKNNFAVYRRKLDGSDQEKLIVYSTESFAIDPKKKRIYYLNGGTLKSANYNGDNVKDHLVEALDLSLPQNLCGRFMYVDGAANRLYWIKKQPASGIYSGDLNEMEKAADYYQNIYNKVTKITDIPHAVMDAYGLEKQGNYIFYAFSGKIYRNDLPGPSVSDVMANTGGQVYPAYYSVPSEKKIYHTSQVDNKCYLFRKNWDGSGQAEKVDFGMDPKYIRMMIAF